MASQRPRQLGGVADPSGGSLYSCIGIAAGVALFSFIGVEVAAMTAKRKDENDHEL
jgi:APA family basic amino acid/polyamine antiporter